MSNSIPDWKKAAAIALYRKYGYRAIANRLDVDYKTIRRYVEMAEESNGIEMDGTNLEVRI